MFGGKRFESGVGAHGPEKVRKRLDGKPSKCEGADVREIGEAK